MKFGEKLKQQRAKAGLTQEELFPAVRSYLPHLAKL